MKPDLKRHFFFWILPTVVVLGYILLYFMGGPLAQSIIAPHFNREIGLLESTQHVLLVMVIMVIVRGLLRAEVPMERLGYALAAGLATFQLLEELSYGVHYVRALGFDVSGYMTNVHNQPGVSTRLKNVGDLVLLLYFFVLPLAVRPSWPAWLRFLAPPRLLVVTVLCSVAVSKFGHYLNDRAELANHILETGVSEFRETFIYYTMLIYVHELVTHRRWPGWKGERGSPFRTEAT